MQSIDTAMPRLPQRFQSNDPRTSTPTGSRHYVRACSVSTTEAANSENPAAAILAQVPTSRQKLCVILRRSAFGACGTCGTWADGLHCPMDEPVRVACSTCCPCAGGRP